MTDLSYLFDRYAELYPEPPYWPANDDIGEHYCRKHALEKAGREGEIDGGVVRETDTCCHCRTCGKLLDYTLTDAGADQELAHFRTVKFRRDKPLDRETAYHLARLCAAKDDLETIFIAAKAIWCMRAIPTIDPNEE